MNLRWYCDLTIDAARLQRDRVLSDGSTRHDLDFYLLCVWRLSELARQAADGYQIEEAASVRTAIVSRWPFLNQVRNWWVHAKEMDWTTWFAESIDRLNPDGDVLPVVDVRDDHDDLESFYLRLCDALGPLPDL